MFHLVDAVATWGMTLIGGLHVTEHFDPKTFATTLRTNKVTQTALPPTLLDMVLRHGIDREDYRSLNRLSFGGAPMPEPLYRKLSSAFGCPLTQSYGASEVSGGVCQQFPRDLLRNGGKFTNSVGQPLPHIYARIVDNDGAPLPPGEVGEIAVAGPRVMAGYWRNEAATKRRDPRWLVPHRRSWPLRCGWPLHHRRSQEGHDHHWRRECLSDGSGERAARTPGRGGSGGVRHPQRTLGRGGPRCCLPQCRCDGDGRRAARPTAAT